MIMSSLISTSQASAAPVRLISFDPAQTSMRWQVVNDTVMGGRSVSHFTIENSQLEFSGYLDTDGGGFASLRSNRLDWDLSEFAFIRLKVRGDGRNYRFRLFVEGDRVSYQSEFETVPGEWRIVELPIDQFYASWRGRRVSRPPLESSEIVGVGVILADGLDGDFNLTLDWIEFDRSSAILQ